MSERKYTREEAQDLERKIGRPLKWIDVTQDPADPIFILAQHQPPLSREHGMFARDRVKQAEEAISLAIMRELSELRTATGLTIGRIQTDLLFTGPMFDNHEGEVIACTVRLSFGA